MTKKAVVIAGDFRTFEVAGKSLAPFLQNADVFVSIWEESNFAHQIEPDKIYSCGTMTEEKVRSILTGFNVVGVEIEPFVREDWYVTGYNSNFLHRLRRGVDMVKATGVAYQSVLFTRPDMFFGMNQELLAAIDTIQPFDFVTIFSNMDRVENNKTLNDTLFAVTLADMDSAIPTVEQLQSHLTEDWHTFYRDFVVNNGLKVRNVEVLQCAILRPPAREGMTFGDVVYNSTMWDDIYIVDRIRRNGLEVAIRDWSFAAVDRAIRRILEVSDDAQSPQLSVDDNNH